MAVITKGSNRGVGFMRLQRNIRNKFNLEKNIKIIIYNNNTAFTFFGRIKNYSGLGLYVPKDLVIENNLLHKKVNICFEKIDGFFTRTGRDGRIYIPKSICENLRIKHGDIISVRGNSEGKEIRRFCLVKERTFAKSTVYTSIFDSKFSRVEGIFKIERKLKKEIENKRLLKNVISHSE